MKAAISGLVHGGRPFAVDEWQGIVDVEFLPKGPANEHQKKPEVFRLPVGVNKLKK